MANSAVIFSILLIFAFSTVPSTFAGLAMEVGRDKIPVLDVELLEFALNLEYLEAEFFLFGAFGYGLDKVAPKLSAGGPPPVGARLARLTAPVRDMIAQFAYQKVGHLRAIKKNVRGFPRPLLDLSPETFAKIIDNALGKKLQPPFDPYANDIYFLIASYLIPYVGLTGYVGASPKLISPNAKRLVGGLLAVESAQDAVIRTLLFERKDMIMTVDNMTLAEFTVKISEMRNKLGGAGLKDEGLVVPEKLGAEGKIEGNIIAGDEYSMAYSRTPEEILSIVYGTGSAQKPGGLYPKGGGGAIAISLLKKERK